MAVYDTSRPFATGATAGRIGSVIVSVISALADWNDTRLTRKSLSQLTDRELDDIGLQRGDIDAVSR